MIWRTKSCFRLAPKQIKYTSKRPLLALLLPDPHGPLASLDHSKLDRELRDRRTSVGSSGFTRRVKSGLQRKVKKPHDVPHAVYRDSQGTDTPISQRLNSEECYIFADQQSMWTILRWIEHHSQARMGKRKGGWTQILDLVGSSNVLCE